MAKDKTEHKKADAMDETKKELETNAVKEDIVTVLVAELAS